NHSVDQSAANGARMIERTGTMCADFALPAAGFTTYTTRTPAMKRITMAAIIIAGASALATVSPAATPAPATRSLQDCSSAQAGRKLTMSRSAVIAEVTKLTGTDGEFAGLKPCDSGYPNAVRFYIDEVIKAGTNNSTP